jgi:hypothetical protein
MKPDNKTSVSSWAGVIRAVQTPLGFLALVVLACEAITSVLAVSLGPSQKTILLIGMLVLLFIAVVIVAAIACVRPSVLGLGGASSQKNGNPRYSLILTAPDRLPNLDVTLIDWDVDGCFLVDGSKKYPVTPVPSRVGPTFEVVLPLRLLDELPKTESVELSLRDRKGNHWRVKRFYLFQTVLPLALGEEVQKIMEDYGGEADA